MKRPRVENILKSNLLMSRIKNFLSETEYEEEFSHTILHKINIFATNQITNTENISNQKGLGINENLESKSESVKVESKDKLRKLSDKYEFKKESKKHSQIREDIKKSQKFEVDSTLTAKKLGEIQKELEREAKQKKLDEMKQHEKEQALKDNSFEEIKEIKGKSSNSKKQIQF